MQVQYEKGSRKDPKPSWCQHHQPCNGLCVERVCQQAQAGVTACAWEKCKQLHHKARAQPLPGYFRACSPRKLLVHGPNSHVFCTLVPCS